MLPLLVPSQATQALHAYRTLLRAASYLPDPFARIYSLWYIKYKFRSQHPHEANPTPTLADKIRDRGRIKRAFKKAQQLDEASQGNLRVLKKFLLLAHGRTGARKRQLIKDLLRPEEGDLPQDSAALQDIINKSLEGPWPNNKPTDIPKKFAQFIASQSRNQPEDAVKYPIRQLRPKIPRENIWGRSTPLKLQESIRRKWWALTLDKIYPPVPEDEFNRLRDLSTGALNPEPLILRRKRPPPEPLGEEGNNAKVLEYIKFPRKITDPKFDEIRYDPELKIITREIHNLPPKDETFGSSPNAKVTAREWRRLYGRIWSLTSIMKKDSTTGFWDVTWGGGKGAIYRGDISQASARDMELFEGIEELPEPVILKKGKKQKRRDKKSAQFRLDLSNNNSSREDNSV